MKKPSFLLTGNETYERTQPSTTSKVQFLENSCITIFNKDFVILPLKIECSLLRYPLEYSSATALDIRRKHNDKNMFVKSSIAQSPVTITLLNSAISYSNWAEIFLPGYVEYDFFRWYKRHFLTNFWHFITKLLIF